MKKNVGENLGQYAPEVFTMVEKVANTYLANPSEKLYELFNLSVNEAPFNEVSDKKFYYLQNDGYKQAEKSYYLKFSDSEAKGVDAYDEADDTQFFIFYKVPNQPGQYYIYNQA